jgi:CYTH domain-containing protein
MEKSDALCEGIVPANRSMESVKDPFAVNTKYPRIERERRFLLNDVPPPMTRASPHVQIWDNYITGTRMRLRYVRVPATKELRWKLTQKFAPEPPDFSRTIITNIYLSEYEYQVLSVFEGNEIRKNRYPYEYDGQEFAIDVFLGRLWGLVLAETSFEDDDQMERLEMPPFAAAEVTKDEMFTGGKLVDLSIEDIRRELKTRGASLTESS